MAETFFTLAVDLASLFCLVEVSDISWEAVPSLPAEVFTVGLAIGLAVDAAKAEEVPASEITRAVIAIFLFKENTFRRELRSLACPIHESGLFMSSLSLFASNPLPTKARAGKSSAIGSETTPASKETIPRPRKNPSELKIPIRARARDVGRPGIELETVT